MSSLNKSFKKIFLHNHNVTRVKYLVVNITVKAHFCNFAVFIYLVKAKNRAYVFRHFAFYANDCDICSALFVSIKKFRIINIYNIVAISHQNISLMRLMKKIHIAEYGVDTISPNACASCRKRREQEKAFALSA